MVTINDHVKTEAFLAEKLLGAQLDSIRLYSIELQLNFLSDSDGGKLSYWVSSMGDITLNTQSSVYRGNSEVLANLYGLLGQRVSAVQVGKNGALSISIGSDVLTVSMDDEAFEIVWSVTPESPESYSNQDWSVTFTDESELVLT